MRVYSTGGNQAFAVAPAEFNRLLAFRDRGSGHNHLRDTGILRSLQYGVDIREQALVGQIDADIDRFDH